MSAYEKWAKLDCLYKELEQMNVRQMDIMQEIDVLRDEAQHEADQEALRAEENARYAEWERKHA